MNKNMIEFGIIIEKPEWLSLDLFNNFQHNTKIKKEREFHIFAKSSNKKFVLSCCKSSPLTAINIEFMREFFKVRYLFRIATCGSLINNINQGSIFLIDSAIRGEGTSLCYIENEYPAVADFYLTNLLLKKILKKNIDTNIGTVWTTDGRFTESNKILKKWKQKGAIAVDMESSAFFIVSRLKNIRAANLCIVTDNPIESKTFKEKYLFKEDREIIIPSLKICINIILSIIFELQDKP